MQQPAKPRNQTYRALAFFADFSMQFQAGIVIHSPVQGVRYLGQVVVRLFCQAGLHMSSALTLVVPEGVQPWRKQWPGP